MKPHRPKVSKSEELLEHETSYHCTHDTVCSSATGHSLEAMLTIATNLKKAQVHA
jgi:hypothetical protein